MGFSALSILCLLVASEWAQTADPSAWNSFYVKYRTYISMPKTAQDAKEGVNNGDNNGNNNGDLKFVLVPEAVHAGSSDIATMVELYCRENDPRVCTMYRKTDGKLAGLRVSFIKKDLTQKKSDLFDHYDYTRIPMFKESDLYDQPAFATEIMFIDPERNLNSDVVEHKEDTADGIWLMLPDNNNNAKWMKMERDESNAMNGGFTKQACLAGMGMHYFYKMNKGLNCSNLQPVFMLYDNKKLVGMGIVPFGTFSTKDWQWYEKVPGVALKMIAPDGPKCLTDMHSEYDVTSLHVYFVKKPAEISCSFSENPFANIFHYYFNNLPFV